jgi:ubiquinone/menaquinone biosynthesis C-methylase UbiE
MSPPISRLASGLLVPQRRFDELKPEMVDMPGADPALLRGELRNLRIINRYLGGLAAVRRALKPMLTLIDSSRSVSILDLATGSGDQPVAIARMCRRLNRRVAITAVDRNDAVLADARSFAAGFDEIRFEKGDVRSLRYSDRSFDIVLCSLAMHHFSWQGAVRLLQEMERLSGAGFIVNDLSRSRLALASAWVYTRSTTTNIMTRTDAIASLYAAFTKEELLALAGEAGIERFNVSRALFFRLVGVRRKNSVSP